MKTIIFSDVHGNIEYFNKLTKYIEIENPDNLIICGDLITPNVDNSVIEYLNNYKGNIYAVRGNCDIEQETNFDYMEIYKHVEIDNKKYFITHGHMLEYVYNLMSPEEILVYGHSHVYELNNKELNPGSVGKPRVNIEHTCMLLDNNKCLLIDLDNLSIIKELKL